jgi:tRNA(adenine34) deaminase
MKTGDFSPPGIPCTNSLMKDDGIPTSNAGRRSFAGLTEKADPMPEGLMRRALFEAAAAGAAGEVPIGAAVVDSGGTILARAGNRVIRDCDPTAHAEIIVLRRAARLTGNYRIPGAVVCATIEPCPMCMGALVHARIDTLVFGAADPRWGAAGTLYNMAGDTRLNHRIRVIPGVLEDECRALIKEFFSKMRNRKTGDRRPSVWKG